MSAVFGLVLLELFYRAVIERSRWGAAADAGPRRAVRVRRLFSEMLLFGRIHPVIWGVRGFAHTLALPLVAVSASRNPEWTFRISVSRNVVFHSTALAVSGLFLLLIAGAGYYMRYFGGSGARPAAGAALWRGPVPGGDAVLQGPSGRA